MVRNCAHRSVCVCVCVECDTVFNWRHGTPTATFPFYVFLECSMQREHMLGKKISKRNPHICWQTPDDQSSIRANTKRCKVCRSASSASAWLPLRAGVSGGVDVVTLILCFANIRGKKLVQLAKGFMSWHKWLSLSWILALLPNTNIGINVCYLLSPWNVI